MVAVYKFKICREHDLKPDKSNSYPEFFDKIVTFFALLDIIRNPSYNLYRIL